MGIEFELPYPPSLNHYKKVGRTVLTKSGKFYQQRVNTSDTKLFYYESWLRVHSLMAFKARTEAYIYENPVEVYLYLYPPDKRRRDVDNTLKVILDSLVKSGAIKDDYLVNKLTVERKEIISPGKVIVSITEI